MPITAIDCLVAGFGLSGRMPLFFSRTVPSSPSCSAVCWCAALVTVVDREPVAGLSNRPKANIWVRIRATAALSVAWFRVPAVRAACTSLALENGIAMSMPPSRSATALPAAPQSETTKPPELACVSSPFCSMSAFAHEGALLTTA